MNNPEDQFSQSFKRKILAEDRDRLSSYLDHARASAEDDRGGRFSAINKTSVTGTAPIAYPKQPDGSPWACDPLPQEPPLGFSVNDHEPVGEAFERKPTMRRLRRL